MSTFQKLSKSGARPAPSLSSPDLTFSLWEGAEHEEVTRPHWPCSGAPAELRELGACTAAFEQLWLAAPFSDFQAVADLCPRFLDFLQWADLQGKEWLWVAGVQACLNPRVERASCAGGSSQPLCTTLPWWYPYWFRLGGSSRDSCLHSAEEAAAEDRFAYLGRKMPVLPLCCASIDRCRNSSGHSYAVMCSSLRTKKQGFRIRSQM